MAIPLTGFSLLLFVLLGQSAALLGTTVSNFALGIWAYEQAGNVSDYTWIAIASTVPGLLIGPFLGVWVDRWPRKRVLIGAQLGNAAVILALILMERSQSLSLTGIVALVPITAICGTLLQVAFTATVVLWVGKDRLNQANGLIGLLFGLVQLVGPLLGGLAMDHLSLLWILQANGVAFVVALATLAVASIPTVARDEVATGRGSVRAEFLEGWRYLSDKRGLMGGLWMFTLIWFSVSVIQVLFVPVVLGFGNKTDLGMIQSAAGFGLLVGGILMVAWKGPSRLSYGIMGPSLVVSVAFLLMPLSTTPLVLAVASFAVMIAVPVATAASQSLWQRKIDPGFQGRVFALRGTIMKAAQPLAFLLAGVLSDRLFEPAMMPGGAWASTLGQWWGTGDGRGAALFMSACGLSSLVLVIVAICVPAIRRADIDLPDYQSPTDPTVPDR